MIPHRMGRPLRALLLLLGALTVSVQAIYPDGHFDAVTKISDAEQLTSEIEESIGAGQTLFVRWIASAG